MEWLRNSNVITQVRQEGYAIVESTTIEIGSQYWYHIRRKAKKTHIPIFPHYRIESVFLLLRSKWKRGGWDGRC